MEWQVPLKCFAHHWRHEPMVDIHNYEQQYRVWEAHVQKSTISERNKALIFGYRDACLLHDVCGKVRLIRAYQVLVRCAALLDKDFDTVTRHDIERVVTTLMQGDRKPATICTYKAILKRFLGWVLRPNEFPRIVEQPKEISWMTVHLKRRDEPRLQRTRLLTPEDIAALLSVCHNPRDKAFISCLWESGGRISELGNRQIKDVVAHEHGYLVELDGKTGRRSALLVSSSAHLATWLSHHPFRDDPESPLWVHYQYRDHAQAIDYDTIRSMLKRHFRRAGIAKPFHPHVFRHSRATYVLANGIMTDAMARQYFGWTSQSTMLGRYAHLVDTDTHNALLRENNLAGATPKPNVLQTRECPRCKTLNAPNAPYCIRCAGIMDEQQAYAAPAAQAETQALLVQLCRVLVEKGLVDDAADQVHAAGLGSVLKALATRPVDTRAPQ